MEIVWLHLRSRNKGKPKEGYYTLLAIDESGDHIAGIKTDVVPESVARTMREHPEVYNDMTPSAAIKWVKETSPSTYKTGWRKFKKREHDYGVGAKILKRFKIGGD